MSTFFSEMIKYPLISVVMPSYNHCNFIKIAIESVIKQTYSNWELIIIDNNSTDGTKELISEFADSRIKIYYISNNGIIARSRNLGIIKSNGEWIAFLDSDDYWLPEKLGISSKYFFDKDFIYHDLLISNTRQSLFKLNKTIYGDLGNNIFKGLMARGNLINNSSVIVRKVLLLEVFLIDENPLFVSAEDYHTWLKIANITNKFQYINKSLGTYREHNGGVSKKNYFLAFENVINEFSFFLNSRDLVKTRCYLNYVKGRYFFKCKQFRKAKLHLSLSFENSSIKNKLKILYMLFIIFINQPRNY